MLPAIGFAAVAIAVWVPNSASFSEKQPNDIVLVAEEKKKETKMGGGVQGAILANKDESKSNKDKPKKKSPTTGDTNYPGSANGGVWKNKDDGKPAVGTPRGYDLAPNKKN